MKGTSASQLDPIGESGLSLKAQSSQVSSAKIQHISSDSDVFVNLYGYCDFFGMLEYRLDRDVALVLASAVDI